MPNEVGKCRCGAAIFDNHEGFYCVECSDFLPDSILAAMPNGSLLRDSVGANASYAETRDVNAANLAIALRWLGVIDLLASILLAIYVSGGFESTRSRFGIETPTNYVAVGAGLSLVVQAVIACVTMWALASILDYVVAIRKEQRSVRTKLNPSDTLSS